MGQEKVGGVVVRHEIEKKRERISRLKKILSLKQEVGRCASATEISD